MQKIIKLSVLFFTSALVLASCSKYDDNPAVSLKSKNGRITGEWTLAKYDYTRTRTAYGTITMTTMTYNGVIMTYTEGGYTNTYSYSEKIKINKDGTYEITVVDEGETDTETGLWSWIDGTSNKELIMLDGNILVIKKLTNKELVVEETYSSSNTYDGKTSSTNYVATSTYEKK